MAPKAPTRSLKRIKTSSTSKEEDLRSATAASSSATAEDVSSSAILSKRKAKGDPEITSSVIAKIKEPKGKEREEPGDLDTALNDRQFAMMLTLEKDPEITLLNLMKNHSFDFAKVQQLLSRGQLDVSISRVKYKDIASHVGLNPIKEGRDMESFDMYRARLPNYIFSEIVKDVVMFAKQYGTPDRHRNEEARARYLSSYFNRIVSMFSGLLFNTPEAIIEGGVTKKGRIEYQFRIFEGVTVIFIEVKPKIGTYLERLNYIGQVIAEADACSLINYKDGFYVPILGVLFVGDSFYFFQFIHHRGSQEANSSFKVGRFQDGSGKIRLDEPDEIAGPLDTKEQIRQLRSICEALYYVFLKAYTNGLDAHWTRSKQRGISEGNDRDSTTEWLQAKSKADAAIQLATTAWDTFKTDVEESKNLAFAAVQSLTESVQSPLFDRASVFPGFTSDMLDQV